MLIDDSRSMQIADTDETPRRAFVESNFGDPESELLAALADRFALRFFMFFERHGPRQDVNELTYSGTRTHVGQALRRAYEELSGVPLSGLVVVTDGADNAEGGLAEGALAAAGGGGPGVHRGCWS